MYDEVASLMVIQYASVVFKAKYIASFLDSVCQ